MDKVRALRGQQHSFSSVQHEQRIMRAIENGDSAAVRTEIENYCGTSTVRLSASDLRNQKYLCVYAVSVSVWAAIRGGLPTDLAFLLRDQLINDMDKLNRVEDVVAFKNNISAWFADCVRDHRLSGSSVIRKAKDYIQKNLYSPFSISDIAAHVGMSRDYLSVLFKRSEDRTILEYIQDQKLREAEYLLANTARPISDISSALGFSSQSHFGTRFKQKNGLTPREYRLKHKII